MFSIPLSFFFLLHSIEFLQLYFCSLIFSSAVSYLMFKPANASYILTVIFFSSLRSFNWLILYLFTDLNSLFFHNISFSFLNFFSFALTLYFTSPTWLYLSHPDSLLFQVYPHIQIFALTDLSVECFHLTTRNMHALPPHFLRVFI